jgi:hypothetical protein
VVRPRSKKIVPDNPLGPLELERLVPMSEVEHLSGMSADTWHRRYPGAIVRLSIRCSAIRLKHVLFIEPPPGAPAVVNDPAVLAQLANARAAQKNKRAAKADESPGEPRC